MDKPRYIDVELHHRIQELIAYKGGGANADIVEDVISNALKLLTDVQDRGDARVIRSTVRELRHAFRLFAPYGNRRKVTIFGSARTRPEHPEYQQAVEFAREIADAGFMLAGSNTTMFQFARANAANPTELPSKFEVHLIVRVDIEDRNFHTETHRNGGADFHFSSHSQPLSPEAGFIFTPAQDRQFLAVCNAGYYHHGRPLSAKVIRVGNFNAIKSATPLHSHSLVSKWPMNRGWKLLLSMLCPKFV